MTEQIAVGVDGSAASRAALDWAARRAASFASSIVLIHVAGTSAEAGNESDLLVQRELEHVRDVSPSVAITFEVHHGEPVKVLAREARRFALLVVGTHKTGYLRGRSFGSMGMRLAAVVPAPFAVIPTSFAGSRRGIIVGVDDGHASLAALRRASAEALRTGAPLTMIHAKTVGADSPLPNALALAKEEFPDVEVRAREVAGLPGEVLVNAAATAEVLCIGGPVAGSTLGAVGHDVLLNISGPTVFVPRERELIEVP